MSRGAKFFINMRLPYGLPPFPPSVKILIIINMAVFLIQFISGDLTTKPYGFITSFFGNSPTSIDNYFFIWQLFTYQFLHGNLSHILINMLVLWMFGAELENLWGKKLFLKFYLICGTGSGIIIYALPKILGHNVFNPTIGASGAVLGVLLAYTVLWPDRYVLLMFIFPVKIKYLTLFTGVTSLIFTFFSMQRGISHVGHLGGLITAYLYMFYKQKKGSEMYLGHNPFLFRLNFFTKIKEYKKNKKWEKDKMMSSMFINKEEKINEILEKINREGIQSLTKEEKMFLKRFSEKLKNKEIEE